MKRVLENNTEAPGTVFNSMVQFFESNGFTLLEMPENKAFRYKRWWLNHETGILIDVENSIYHIHKLPEGDFTYDDILWNKYYMITVSFGDNAALILNSYIKILGMAIREIEGI